ncbi:hypothetical protein E5N71_06635 [Candidatus Nitrosocosmicus sp. SS]|nr:hypothetical protein E5N71_06635 [Candidatus Nitrosocosmicus sp. SS]
MLKDIYSNLPHCISMVYIFVSFLILVGILLYLNNSVFGLEWKTFSNAYVYLELPSAWNITETSNNLIDSYGADIRIVNPTNKDNAFSIKYSNFITAKEISQSNLESASYSKLSNTEKHYNITLLEGPDLFTYTISGYPTSSTILEYQDQKRIYQEFIVDRKDKATILKYSNTPELFDSTESQKTLHRMIDSIRLL